MVYLTTSICAIVYTCLSLFLIKTYQLCAYKPTNFLSNVFMFNFSFGDKNKLRFTKRIFRFIFCVLTVSFALFFLINFFTYNVALILFFYSISLVFMPFLLVFVHFLLYPVEIMIKKAYIYKAKSKLKKYKIIKIGITGSYGKTSTKNILATILEKEFKVCSTPKNYNTEMGLTKTILEHLDDHDILIAEMGARHKGDIEVLAKMIKPNYGIITTIGPQHLETFKNLQTIEETKNELAKNLDENGVMIFNGDSKSTKKLYSLFTGEKYLACDKDGFSYADNIKFDSSGSSFDMVIDGHRMSVKTCLLGRCNINNIVTASTLAYILGIKTEDIVSAIKTLSPTPHRLEIIKNGYLTIIDDAYNSNMVGASEALKVLSKFGGSKIVVTPGFVEMGNEQSEANFKLGALIADVADYIVVMNEINKNQILSGAISHNFEKEKIFFANTRKDQKEVISMITTKDCVILFENDLPDNYK